MEIQNPIELFRKWYKEAETAYSGDEQFTAMCLATSTPSGVPSARMVLLRGVTEQGFYFFTNYESRKSQEIKSNPKVACVIYWPLLHKQVRIEGIAIMASEEESDRYFNSRSKGSQLSAIVSKQSQVLESKDKLINKWNDLQEFYKDKVVTRPKFWGGWCILPQKIEFWMSGKDRLHDRIRYFREHTDSKIWSVEHLSP
eukprot:TRINITY_DN11902_c0_g1_i1.p1 TRINITY_DN11902_c0_g1~~TRINITY_DN11902_c0_g1_i1.p1  ORF type:complete len:199 (+),score=29.73 TRINITY_DN11902_c0_g1_i1:84-680(+)